MDFFPCFLPQRYNSTQAARSTISAKNRSLNAKTNIICKTVSCCRCIQLKYRIRYVDSAVWQPKENVLRKIPCCMYGKRTPETVHIIYHEGKQNSDKKNIQDRKNRDPMICQMQ